MFEQEFVVPAPSRVVEPLHGCPRACQGGAPSGRATAGGDGRAAATRWLDEATVSGRPALRFRALGGHGCAGSPTGEGAWSVCRGDADSAESTSARRGAAGTPRCRRLVLARPARHVGGRAATGAHRPTPWSDVRPCGMSPHDRARTAARVQHGARRSPNAEVVPAGYVAGVDRPGSEGWLRSAARTKVRAAPLLSTDAWGCFTWNGASRTRCPRTRSARGPRPAGASRLRWSTPVAVCRSDRYPAGGRAYLRGHAIVCGGGATAWLGEDRARRSVRRHDVVPSAVGGLVG